MTREAGLQRLQMLAEGPEVDEYALTTEAIAVGSDLQGLVLLVDRFSHSPNELLVRAVTFPLARAPWDLADATPELSQLVIRFLRSVGGSDDPGTLIGCASALQGVNAKGWLHPLTGPDRQTILEFLRQCLSHPDLTVVGACLALLGHLVADHTLDEALPIGGREELRSQILDIAAASGDEFRREVAALRDLVGEVP